MNAVSRTGTSTSGVADADSWVYTVITVIIYNNNNIIQLTPGRTTSTGAQPTITHEI